VDLPAFLLDVFLVVLVFLALPFDLPLALVAFEPVGFAFAVDIQPSSSATASGFVGAFFDIACFVADLIGKLIATRGLGDDNILCLT